MHKSIISLASALTLAALATSPTIAAEPAKAPTNKAECMKLLRGFAEIADSGNVTRKALAQARPMGRAMGVYCRAERFKDAFDLYQKISKTLTAKK
ncbi:MAG: hypothetical protein L3J67_08030 [Hyphomicrobiaceae bacterium]|nr:hypothetical protein [Hyphomicrobiaceae bacterium]